MRVLKAKNGFLVSTSERFGTPIFVSAKSVDEIDSDNVYLKFQCIYGKRSLKNLEKKFAEQGKPLEEETLLKEIFEKIYCMIEERNDFDLEMANLEWEMSMAVHRYR